MNATLYIVAAVVAVLGVPGVWPRLVSEWRLMLAPPAQDPPTPTRLARQAVLLAFSANEVRETQALLELNASLRARLQPPCPEGCRPWNGRRVVSCGLGDGLHRLCLSCEGDHAGEVFLTGRNGGSGARGGNVGAGISSKEASDNLARAIRPGKIGPGDGRR
jgi:hypothetical protein